MSNRKAATAAVLAGAVVLASAAYGIGTQTGDGTAAAARDGAARDRAPRLGGLADEVGVDPRELRDAFADFFEQDQAERRDAFATALAEALDKPVDEVEAALGAVRPGEGTRPGCAPHVSLRRLAAALDVSRAELREALREARAGADDDWQDHHDDLVAFLADRLGLSEDEVREALPVPRVHVRPFRHGAGGPPAFGADGPPPFAPEGPPPFEREGRPG